MLVYLSGLSVSNPFPYLVGWCVYERYTLSFSIYLELRLSLVNQEGVCTKSPPPKSRSQVKSSRLSPPSSAQPPFHPLPSPPFSLMYPMYSSLFPMAVTLSCNQGRAQTSRVQYHVESRHRPLPHTTHTISRTCTTHISTTTASYITSTASDATSKHGRGSKQSRSIPSYSILQTSFYLQSTIYIRWTPPLSTPSQAHAKRAHVQLQLYCLYLGLATSASTLSLACLARLLLPHTPVPSRLHSVPSYPALVPDR